MARKDNKPNEIPNHTALLSVLKLTDADEIREGTEPGLKLHTNGKGQGYWWLWYKSPTEKNAKGEKASRKMRMGKVWLSHDSKGILGKSLADARKDAGEALTLVANGIDPQNQRDELAQAQAEEGAAKKAQEAEQARLDKINAHRAKLGERPLPPKDSFEDCAERVVEEMRKDCKPAYCNDWIGALRKHCSPIFGNLHVNDVEQEHITQLYETMIAAGNWAQLDKVKSASKAVFAWAIHPKRKLRVKACPVYKDRDLFKRKPESVPHATAENPEQIRTLVLALRNAPKVSAGRNRRPIWQAPFQALYFTLLTAQRSMNILRAEFTEMHDLDGDAPRWVIPAAKMKGQRVELEKGKIEDHVIYLSSQAVELVKAQRAAHPDSKWLFPGSQTPMLPPNAMNRAMEQLGFGKDDPKHGFVVKPHGLRATVRMACEDYLGYSSDNDALVLEMVLAHKEAREASDQLGKIMQRARTGGMKSYRRKNKELEANLYDSMCLTVMQDWADWLNGLEQQPQAPHLTLVERPLPVEAPRLQLAA